MGGGTVTPQSRSKSTAMLLSLIGVIILIIGVAVFSLKRPPRQTAVAPPVVVTQPVVEKPVEPPPPPPVEPVVEPVQPPPPAHGKPQKGRPQKQVRPPKGQPGTPTTTPNTASSDAARFGDKSHTNIPVNPGGGGSASRPPPAQADITKVIANNRAQIKVCYQRALTRDNSLTHGKLNVKVSIGISGRVKHVGLDGPAGFRTLLEPCIREVVTRWVFPQGPDEYATEFPLVFQGNE
jgi:protein TonB